MILGISATTVTFVLLVVNITAYFLYHQRKEESMLTLARITFYAGAGLIFLQAALLMYGILTHQFQWIYVFSYSSKDLPIFYLISTFWAGQEGTFLLWLLMGSIYGIVIIRARKDDEPLVMSFMNMVQAFIVMILIKKNPFTYVWDINPAAFGIGQIPLDGNGLNPLLQDPWMTIHPPILFFGYSSSMILFAFAMSALVRKNYNDWINNVYSYALFVGLTLGAGIILGGYWAYTTLGWGGYWGWDPVENSSLIPWLTSLALIHGIVIQRRQGGMKKSNIFLALVTFILVLYSTFLTRSGVLTDFSVHSFGSSELNQYLTGFVLLFLSISVFAFLFRAHKVKGEKVQSALFSRESFILFGILVLMILAILTFIGTSSPIITGIFGTASNVSVDYYNTLAGPIAILMAVFIGLTPVLRWKSSSREKFRSLILHALLSLTVGAVIFYLGIRDLIPIIISVLAIFLILVNGEIVIKMWRKKNYKFGGYFTHVGVGLMLIGIITSSVYDRSTKITLPLGIKRDVMGYAMEYRGKQDSPDGKDKVIININDRKTHANFYWSEYNRAYMVAPSVSNMILRDLYVSPIQIIPADEIISKSADDVLLKKGQETVYNNYIFTFIGYEMDEHARNDGSISIAALIDVADKDHKLIGSIKPGLTINGKKKDVVPVDIPGSKRSVFIKGVNVDAKSITLAVSKPVSGHAADLNKELLAVEVSVKPLINILWLGTILMMIGFLIAAYQYTRRVAV